MGHIPISGPVIFCSHFASLQSHSHTFFFPCSAVLWEWKQEYQNHKVKLPTYQYYGSTKLFVRFVYCTMYIYSSSYSYMPSLNAVYVLYTALDPQDHKRAEMPTCLNSQCKPSSFFYPIQK